MYRPSASLIIASKIKTNEDQHNDYDYRVLVFKRTESTSYAPNHCVFPGGTFEEAADESIEWLKYFKDFGISQNELKQLALANNCRPRPLLTSGKNFSRDISLRITAIRETFEEVGVLLCRDHQQARNDNIPLSRSGHVVNDAKLVHWQRRVHDDPKKFIELCRHFRVVPDIWSLAEWSVWRSPSTASRKFETAFYFVSLDKTPALLLEPSEVDVEKWGTPSELLSWFRERSIWLPPIQFYELSRLTHIRQWFQLRDFSQQRSNKGSTMLMPVYYRCTDALVGTLPGDECYPEDPLQCEQTIDVHSTAVEFNKRFKHLHRIIIRNTHDLCVKLTILPIDNHLSPVEIKSADNKL